MDRYVYIFNEFRGGDWMDKGKKVEDYQDALFYSIIFVYVDYRAID